MGCECESTVHDEFGRENDADREDEHWAELADGFRRVVLLLEK